MHAEFVLTKLGNLHLPEGLDLNKGFFAREPKKCFVHDMLPKKIGNWCTTTRKTLQTRDSLSEGLGTTKTFLHVSGKMFRARHANLCTKSYNFESLQKVARERKICSRATCKRMHEKSPFLGVFKKVVGEFADSDNIG